jgi:hypothetical protein
MRHPFLGGHFGPLFNRQALDAGKTWKDLQKFAADVSDSVFVSRNLDALRSRKVEMLFHPGTHDFVAFDLAWGGAHHRDIPVYLRANSGHGQRKAHPAAEPLEQNKAAFLLRHFFPDEIEELLKPPALTHRISDGKLIVEAKLPPESGEESGRIWWIADRPIDGSPGYLSQLIPDKNSAEMTFTEATNSWVATIEFNPGVKRVDVFSSHRKTVSYHGKPYATYISSPYTRVAINTPR